MKNAPEYILQPGTKVVTNDALDSIAGMRVSSHYLTARKPGVKATLGQPVGGHGGDVYWATHEDGSEAVYCWTEFELDEVGQVLASFDADIEYFKKKIEAALRLPPIASAHAKEHLALLEEARMKYVESRGG